MLTPICAPGAARRHDRRAGAVISERRVDGRGVDTRVLEVEGPRPEHPVLLVHGNPSNAGDWRPFLEALEGRRRCARARPARLGRVGPRARRSRTRWTRSPPGSRSLLDALARAALRPGRARLGRARAWSRPQRRAAGRRAGRCVINSRPAAARLPLALGRAAVAPARRRRAAERDHARASARASSCARRRRARARCPRSRTDPRAHGPRHEARDARALPRRRPGEVRRPPAATSASSRGRRWSSGETPTRTSQPASRTCYARGARRRGDGRAHCPTRATGPGSTGRTLVGTVVRVPESGAGSGDIPRTTPAALWAAGAASGCKEEKRLARARPARRRSSDRLAVGPSSLCLLCRVGHNGIERAELRQQRLRVRERWLRRVLHRFGVRLGPLCFSHMGTPHALFARSVSNVLPLARTMSLRR